MKIDVEYTEREGFMIQRGDKDFWVYGTCDGTWDCHNIPHKYDEPDESWSERIYFSFDVDHVSDCDGNHIDIELTTEEYLAFASYLEDRLEAEFESKDWDEYTVDEED